MLRWILLSLFALVGLAQAAETSTLTIDSSQGLQSFKVELATTPAQMELGLLYRQNLAAPIPGTVSIPASSVSRPSDEEHADPPRHAVHRRRRAYPPDRRAHDPAVHQPHPSGDPVRAVLEINGGAAERLGIHAGDMVHSPSLGTGG
jgi:hypothetical protein